MKKPALFIIALLLVAVVFGNLRLPRIGNPYADRNGDGMPDSMPVPSCDLVPYGVPQTQCNDGSMSPTNIRVLIAEWLK